MSGEAADVQLVDDRVGERPVDRVVVLPVVPVRVGDDALHGGGEVRAWTRRGVAIVPGGNGDGTTVRIEEHLGGVEPQPARLIDWSVGAIAVYLAGTGLRHARVPVVRRAMSGRIERDDTRRLGRLLAVEQQQVDPRRAFGKDAEVDAAFGGGRAERRACARRDTAGDGHSVVCVVWADFAIRRAW